MNDDQMNKDSEQSSIGRIEIAPEVLTTIAHYTTLNVDGVNQMAQVPADVIRLFRRSTKQNGVILDFSNESISFEIYILMEPHVNVLETSRVIQASIVEAIDKMVGIPVEIVNVHVEDVVYSLDEAA